MCNTCGCRNSNGNNRRNSNCGCVNFLRELLDAINNLFTNPCGCGCGNNNNGCGCNGNTRGGNGTVNLSNLTCCGNYDDYYAQQYGLASNGCCCSR